MNLQQELISSMKNKDKRRTAILKDIIGTAKNIAISNNRKDPIDEDYTNALNKIRKTVQEQIDTCPSDRIDRLKDYKTNFEILSEYLPKQLSKDEVYDKIKSILKDKEFNNLGDIMKIVMPELKGKADGKVINEQVKRYMKED